MRELRNAIEHALILSRGSEILPEHLPAPVNTSLTPDDSGQPGDLEIRLGQLLRSWTEERIRSLSKESPECDDLYEQFLRLLEPDLLTTVMQHFDNQYLAASKVLGIHRTTLKKKLVEHGIDKETIELPEADDS